MPGPTPSFDTVTVYGRFLNFAGMPITGTVTFTPTAIVRDVAGKVLLYPVPISISLDVLGAFSASLPATDDPDISGSFLYRYKENWSGGRPEFLIQVPLSTPAPGLDMTIAGPASPVSPSVTYVTTQMLNDALAGTGGGLSTEGVQDVVGAMVLPGPGLSRFYDDPAGTLTLAVKDNLARDARALQVGAHVTATATGAATYDALAALETDLGVTFPRTSNYIGVSGVAGSAGQATASYTGEVAPMLAARPDRSVTLVVEPYAGASGETKDLPELVTCLTTTSGLTTGQALFRSNLIGLIDAVVAGAQMDRVRIAFGHECNGSGASYPWQIYKARNSSALFVQAFRAFVTLARSRGYAGQFEQWFLQSNSGRDIAGNTNLEDYSVHYAGDAYVDVIGLSYYNRFGAGDSGYSYWEPVGHNLRPPYRQIAAMTQRPISISESGCAPEGASGESKAQWLADLLLLLNSGEFPQVESITQFLVDGSPGTANWTALSCSLSNAAPILPS